jgi:hypothetical protein
MDCSSKPSSTHQLMIHADDGNLLGESMYVKLKDRKRSLSRKKLSQHVVALEKQPQREISCCGCF